MFFFLVNVSVILFWFSSERKETIYFLSGRIKAKNLQCLYCQPRPCSNTGRWIINLSLFCCEAWFTGVIPWQAKDEHCWLCVPSIHYGSCYSAFHPTSLPRLDPTARAILRPEKQLFPRIRSRVPGRPLSKTLTYCLRPFFLVLP